MQPTIDKRADLNSILYEMSLLSHSSSMTDKSLSFIVESIERLFGFNHILLALYDNISNKFVPQLVVGFGETESNVFISAEINIDPSFFSVSSVKVPPEPIDYFKTLELHSLLCRFSDPHVITILESNGFSRLFLLPMMTAGKLLGAVIVFLPPEGPDLSDQKLRDLSILVQISTFLTENLTLKIANNQKISKMTTLYEISQQTKNILKPADALGSLVDVLKRIEYNMCALYVINPENKKELILKEFRGDDPTFMGSPIAITSQGPVGEVAVTLAPLLTHYSIYKSFMAVPIIIDEVLIGVICLGSQRSYAYNEGDIITVKILSTQVASIDNLFSTLVNIRSYTEAIIESMPLGIVTIDTGGHVNIINQTAKLYLNITKFTHEDIIGKTIDEIFDKSSRVLDIFRNALSKGTVFDSSEIHNASNQMTFEITTFQFKNADGMRLGLAMFMRDITKLKRMEEHIRRTDRLSAVGELAAGIAHEIRNPLTGIKMMIQILDKDFAAKDSNPNKYTRAMLEEIDRLDNIISNLLNFARPSKPEFSNTPIIDVIESTLFLLQSKVDSMNISIIRDYRARDPRALCDAAQMKQVIFNICQNAMHALRDGAGHNIIKITVTDEEGWLIVSVADSGCGIPRENFRQIFNPFFTTKDNGTGLGLSIVHRILEEHKGNISVESEVGRGSTFTIRVPQNAQ